MPSIRLRQNSYELTAYVGYDSTGKQIKKTKSWKIPKGMSSKKAEKEAMKAANNFEQLCITGQIAEKGKIKLIDFVKQWFETYAVDNLRPTTIKRYNDLYYGRIDPIFGAMYIDQITPSRIDAFYHELKNTKIAPKYQCTIDFKKLLRNWKLTQEALAIKAQVSISVIRSCVQHKNIEAKCAERISSCLNLSVSQCFKEVEMGTLSDKTRLEYHRLLSTIFASAMKKGYIISNPCARTDPPKVVRKDAVFLDEEQAGLLLDCLQNEPIYYRVPIMTLLFTGMRRGELLGLEWKDVNFDTNTIDINKSSLYLPQKGVFDDETKNQSSHRVIKIYRGLSDELLDFRTWQYEEKFKLGNVWCNSPKVCTTAEGQSMRPDTLTNWFAGFIERNPDLPRIHLHSLRHSNASLMISEGVDIVTVAGMLGHANASTTTRIYAHQIKSAQAAAADCVGNILNRRTRKACENFNKRQISGK